MPINPILQYSNTPILQYSNTPKPFQIGLLLVNRPGNMHPIDTVKKIMAEFAESTGLSEVESPPRRYLWTDAFAVCNFIELHRQTRTENWRRLALALVDQVHSTLGRHRKDDSRTG